VITQVTDEDSAASALATLTMSMDRQITQNYHPSTGVEKMGLLIRAAWQLAVAEPEWVGKMNDLLLMGHDMPRASMHVVVEMFPIELEAAR